MHTFEGPVIVPALAVRLTSICFVAVAVPQLLVTAYLIVSIPGATPVTMPPVTVAVALLLLHAPPMAGSVSIIVDPTHTPDGPDMVPAFGAGLIVIIFDAVVPDVPVVVYKIVSMPAVTPVTIPPVVTVASALLLLHTPPAVVSVNVTDEPTQTTDGPDMPPAPGSSVALT